MPQHVDSQDITLFAKTNFRGKEVPFGIKTDDRRRHMYVIGKTGMGKSTVMENMIIQDIRAGRGLAVVDPHGDLVEKILAFIPPNRVNDVVYFNPSDVDYPIAFNVLESISSTHRHLVASGLIGVFKKVWADSWGPRLEYILRNTILALVEYPGSTLLGVTRMLVDKEYQKKVTNTIADPIIKAFWNDEFSAFNTQFRTEAVSPIQNKIGQFLSSSIIRNIVGQPKSTIDIRDIMDNGKILLMNLSKGRIGEDNSALLGAMMITKLQLAAMSRIDIPEKDRRDFYLYVDEFQNFATESFAGILSEARKYRLNLIVAHQYIEQLDEKVSAAVFGNVGTIASFRVGAGDAEFLAKEFFPTFTETDLVNLTKYDMYLKLMIDGVASEPFSATGLPPATNPSHLEDTIIRVSRERYAKPREVVEEKISRWTLSEKPTAGSGDDRRPPRRDDRGERREHEPRREPRESRPADEPPVEYQREAPVVIESAIPAPLSLAEALQQSPPKPPPEKREHRQPEGERSERRDARPRRSDQRSDSDRPSGDGSRPRRDDRSRRGGEGRGPRRDDRRSTPRDTERRSGAPDQARPEQVRPPETQSAPISSPHVPPAAPQAQPMHETPPPTHHTAGSAHELKPGEVATFS